MPVFQARLTAPRKFCFVLMPFAKEFDDVYELGIKAACKASGAYCERLDKQIFTESMLDRIYNQISKADLIVADMTGRNANVFYEVGYAHALGKRTILVTANGEDIPFDLKHYPHIVYDEGISKLKSQLARKIKHFVTAPDDSALKQFDVDVAIVEARRVRVGGRADQRGSDMRVELVFTVRNSSTRTLTEGNFAVGIYCKEHLNECYAWRDSTYKSRYLVKCVNPPEGGYLHVLPDFGRLFPKQIDQIEVHLEGLVQEEETPFVFSIRVFTESEFRDFDCSM